MENNRQTLLVFRVTKESLTSEEIDALFESATPAVGVLPMTDTGGLIALCGAWVRLSGGVARVGDSLIVPEDPEIHAATGESAPAAPKAEPWTRPPDEELN